MPVTDNGDELLVAIQGPTALVRVRGRGSFKTAPALREFGHAAVARGCERVIMDMDECVGMDSTFMGVMAGLCMQLKAENAGVMVVMNLGQKTMVLLETLGIGQLLQMHMAGTLPDSLKQHLSAITDISKLDISNRDKKVTLETMLTAHEDLVSVSKDNLPKFRDVMSYLSKELRQLNGGG
jgi:anti-anti-sigma regulatory factor